ncbi:hypothetical protein F5Y16DRAFT_395136 [Xylariaceae sp. FL0255]|nr:hypothetical protein F5Y16DRAFT_395136 [Xylariaceae sp. FL0255]
MPEIHTSVASTLSSIGVKGLLNDKTICKESHHQGLIHRFFAMKSTVLTFFAMFIMAMAAPQGFREDMAAKNYPPPGRRDSFREDMAPKNYPPPGRRDGLREDMAAKNYPPPGRRGGFREDMAAKNYPPPGH